MSEILDHAHIFSCPRLIDKYFKMTSGGPMTIAAADLGFYTSGFLKVMLALLLSVWMMDG